MKKLDQWVSHLLDRISDYIAKRRGILLFFAIGLVVLSLILRLIPVVSPGFAEVFLYLGVIVGFAGVLLGDAL